MRGNAAADNLHPKIDIEPLPSCAYVTNLDVD